MTHSNKDRFAFGKNWTHFLDTLDEAKVTEAEQSLTDYLGNLEGKTFLDIGSGSGLFSLAARNLGARVVSFDYDPASVRCAQTLKDRFWPSDDDWKISQGDVLNEDFMAGLGYFDIVYSWGVLHHTGSLWTALGRASSCVENEGILFIAIYNDQGGASRRWSAFKHFFINRPEWVQDLLTGAYIYYWELRLALINMVRGKNPFTAFRRDRKKRGMEKWHDAKDWLGGFPFEYAKPEEIFDFHKLRGFELERMKTCAGGHGCNEFVFLKKSNRRAPDER